MTIDPKPSRTSVRPPAVVPQAGWQAVSPLRLEGGRGSFVSGDAEGDTLRVAYFRHGDRLVGRAWFGPGAAGPPGHAHGGSMAAVLDEAMGAAAWLRGDLVLAAHLELDFRRLLPLGTDAYFAAWVARHEGRRVFCRGALTDAAGEPFAEAQGTFVRLEPERDRALLLRVAESLGREPDELLADLRRRLPIGK